MSGCYQLCCAWVCITGRTLFFASWFLYSFSPSWCCVDNLFARLWFLIFDQNVHLLSVTVTVSQACAVLKLCKLSSCDFYRGSNPFHWNYNEPITSFNIKHSPFQTSAQPKTVIYPKQSPSNNIYQVVKRLFTKIVQKEFPEIYLSKNNSPKFSKQYSRMCNAVKTSLNTPSCSVIRYSLSS